MTRPQQPSLEGRGGSSHRGSAARHPVGASEASAEDALRAILSPGAWVFLDGRNEHGTHVLTTNFGSAPIAQEDLDGAAEDIMRGAEAAGFVVGDCVWTRWTWFAGQFGFEGRCEIAPCWEFDRVDAETSRKIADLSEPREAQSAQRDCEPPQQGPSK